MILWQLLVKDAKAKRIDRDSEKARAWVHKHLPELLIIPVDEKGRRHRGKERGPVQELFDWQREWPIWERNFKALLWLANRHETFHKPHSLGDRIPTDVSNVLDEVIKQTRNWIPSDWFSSANMALAFTNRAGELAGFHTKGSFDDLGVFWQAVFVSLFQPESLPSRCSNCGRALKATKKGKVSRTSLCSTCRGRKWRSLNQEHVRELWRESKQREKKRQARAL